MTYNKSVTYLQVHLNLICRNGGRTCLIAAVPMHVWLAGHSSPGST